MNSRHHVALSLLLFGVVCNAAEPRPDPYANPKEDIYNPIRYIPSDTLTGIATAVLGITTSALAWNTWKYGARYMLCMVIAGVCFTFGIAMRFAFARDPHSLGKFIIQHLFIILSPCGFIAADYILLGRLTQHLRAGQFLYIRPELVTRIFVSSDVITFLIQSAGGGMVTVRTGNLQKVGEKMFLIGLILQLLSFIFFSGLFLSLVYRIRQNAPRTWHMDEQGPWTRDWRTLGVALGLSCIGIIIRSVFRTIEFTQGWHGHLATTEGYFYVLDVIPLTIAVAVFIPFWPGKYISEGTATLIGNIEDQNKFVPIAQGSQDAMELNAVKQPMIRAAGQ